ncbi:hypothetical protein K7432_014691, partial [Basidiobolus ranarum]
MFKPPKNPTNITAASKRKSFAFPPTHNSSEREINTSDTAVDTRRFSPTPLSNHTKVSNGLMRSKSTNNRHSLPASKTTTRPLPLPRISSPPLSSSASDISTSSTASYLSSKGGSMFKPPPRPSSPSHLQIGDKVQVESMGILGTLRFIGSTKFKPGIWAGIELDQEGTGKNDGIVDGIKYFSCAPKSGLFILAHKVSKIAYSNTYSHCTPISESASELSEECFTSTKTIKRASVPASLYKSNSTFTDNAPKRASFGFKDIVQNDLKGLHVDNDADTEADDPHQLGLKLEILEAENEFLKLEVKQTKSNSEIGILRTEIESLRRQKQEWEREKAAKFQLVELLETEMKDLRHQLSDTNVIDQHSSIDSATEYQSPLKDAEMNRLLSTVRDVKEVLKIRTAIEKELRDRIARLETSDNGDVKDSGLIESLQSELEERSIEVGKLTARLDRTKSDFEKEKAQLIENLSNAEKGDSSKYRSVNDDKEDVNGLLKKLQQQEITIKSQEKLLRDFKAAGAEAFDHYERTLQSMKKENFSLKEQAENVVNVCRQLESDAESLRFELEKAKAREEELTKESTSLQEAVDNYQLSNSKRKEEIQKLKLELQRQSSEILSLTEKQMSGMTDINFNEEKVKLLSQIEELLSSISSLEAEKSDIVRAHEELLESHDKTKSEMAKIRALFEQFDTERHSWVEQQSNLQQQLDAFREMIELKDRELQDSKEELTKLNEFLEERNREIDALKFKIQELESLERTNVDTLTDNTREADHGMEISQLKEKLACLQKEHSATLEENRKLQDEHAELTEAQENLLEMHTHMETECLKLMEEVERLHSESLENSNLSAVDSVASLPADTNNEHESSESGDLQSSLYEKDRILAQLKQQYKTEIREMQKKITDLELSKQYELDIQAKDMAELESLVENKIFRETELEEQIAELKQKIAQLEKKLENAKSSDSPSHFNDTMNIQDFEDGNLDRLKSQTSFLPTDDEEELFCELCDSKGHDILSCTEYSLTSHSYDNEGPSDAMFCENCEEFGDHWTDDCPNQDE